MNENPPPPPASTTENAPGPEPAPTGDPTGAGRDGHWPCLPRLIELERAPDRRERFHRLRFVFADGSQSQYPYAYLQKLESGPRGELVFFFTGEMVVLQGTRLARLAEQLLGDFLHTIFELNEKTHYPVEGMPAVDSIRIFRKGKKEKGEGGDQTADDDAEGFDDGDEDLGSEDDGDEERQGP